MSQFIAAVLVLAGILATALLLSQLDRSLPGLARPGLVGRIQYAMANFRLNELGALSPSDEHTRAAAALLSIEPNEIYAVAESSDDKALLVRTTDGVAYIIQEGPNDEPVVSFLVPPSPNYGGTFPVFSQPSEQTPEGARTHEDDLLELLGVDLPRPGTLTTDPLAEATVEALAADTGPPSEPVPAPGPEHAEDVADAARVTADSEGAALEDAEEKAEAAGDDEAAEKVEKAEAATKRGRRS